VPPPFVPFGKAHAVALLLTALLCATLAAVARRAPERTGALALRLALAAALATLTAVQILVAIREGWFSLEQLVPLHLCDLSILLAVGCLLTLQRALTEVLYFWAMSGTLLAMLSPDLPYGFPDPAFLLFFGLHGLVVVSAVTLTAGLGVTPRRGAPRRVFLWTIAYAVLVAAVNQAFGTNFLFLCAKPDNRTLLDYLGPWPVYLLVCAAIGCAAFHILELPFRASRRP
jgi:hypothetical integral membrane protein (TIGR02206 family)